MPSKLHLCGGRLASAACNVDLTPFGEAVDRQEAEIVRRELVFDSGIAQTDDQLHSFFLPSAFLPPSAFAASGAASSVSCLPFLITSGSAGVAATSAPTFRSNTVLWPLSEWRMRLICLGLTVIAIDSFFAP